jgi:cytochrome c553
MNNKLVPIFALAGLVLAASPIQAESLVSGSADAGKAKALTCTACHGPEGNSSSPLWPNIAGQNAPYIQAQLMAFKDGSRKDPLMSSQAMLLSAEESLVARGEALYRGGDKESGASACLACHGPTGRGNPAAKYPALNGQHAAYTSKQLQAYSDGIRETDGKTRIMRDIAARLDKDDIAAVASYVQGLK